MNNPRPLDCSLPSALFGRAAAGILRCDEGISFAPGGSRNSIGKSSTIISKQPARIQRCVC